MKFEQSRISESLIQCELYHRCRQEGIDVYPEYSCTVNGKGCRFDLVIFIPLRRENVSYEVYGVSSAIDTYFWDFYGAGIRMVSDEAWAMSIEFITAQNNVMKELREEGLL